MTTNNQEFDFDKSASLMKSTEKSDKKSKLFSDTHFRNMEEEDLDYN
jgi:hypothetical protein